MEKKVEYDIFRNMKKIEWARAICYSGYREGQSPGAEIYPSKEQILEDLNIIVKDGFKYIRMYDANEYAENVCKVIRENKLPLQLMLGPGLINEVNNVGCAWDPNVYSEEQLKERAARNRQRIDNLIKIANDYSDVIFSVSVGNENTPTWGENTVPEDVLVEFAERLKKETGKIVTFNEGAREWKKLAKLAAAVDVICIHTYPLWYGNYVEEAVEINKQDYKDIQALYPDKQILISEAGWATCCKPGTEMKDDAPSEENQVKYYKEFWDWTDSEKIIAFVFEAFDEPWKGSADPKEAEKHWGLYFVDRTPKKVMKK